MFKFQITKEVKIHNNIQKIIFKWSLQKTFVILKSPIFFAISKFFYNNKTKFQENSPSALQPAVNWIKFIKWDSQCYSGGRSNFQEKPTVGLPELSKMIDSVISKRQGDQRKQSFLENKILHKKENGFTMNTQKCHITWSIVLWSNQIINFTKFVFISQNV